MVQLVLAHFKKDERNISYSQGHIVERDVEACGTARQVFTDQTGNILTLCDQLTGVELRNNALQNLVHNRREDTLVEILAKGTINLG